MTDILIALIAMVPPTIVALGFYRRSVAAEKRAEAEKIWAARIDPMNPHFRQPLIGRRD